MPRWIAILGASGSLGSSLAVHLLRSRLLEPADTLLLVGHGVLKTERKLLSTRIDLMDAFDDDRICIEIVPDVCDVEADIVIVAAGASLSAGQSATRRDLGATNRVVFEHIADQCASRLLSRTPYRTRPQMQRCSALLRFWRTTAAEFMDRSC